MKNLLFKTTTAILFCLSIFVSCEEDGDDAGPSNGSSSYAGVWVRVIGASGDETDLAIGSVTGEGSSRVWMCEKKGSTAAGLYKGTISGSTITWDATYGLPNTKLGKSGSQLTFYYPSVSTSLLTYYNSGSWSGQCTSLGTTGNSGSTGGNSGSTTGSATFWVSSDFSCGNITVSVNGQNKTITSYYSNGTPNCAASGCANFTLAGGSYSFTASCSGHSWQGTINVTSGGCSRMQLTR